MSHVFCHLLICASSSNNCQYLQLTNAFRTLGLIARADAISLPPLTVAEMYPEIEIIFQLLLF